MGWLSWQRFRCNTDCTNDPDHCISEDLYTSMADRLANDGWLELGYTQINIDDCWNTMSRNSTTNEQMADSTRFPHGIKYIADYVHNLNLKLGLYNDIGSKSCAGYTGIDGNYALDANTFASWEIDMIKIDGCYADTSDMYEMYPKFGAALNATGRNIIYSCSWPAYISGHGEDTNPIQDNTTMAQLAQYCNLWRNYDDITDSWDSVSGIADYWRRPYANYSNTAFLSVAGPGNWNDPDMLVIGCNGLSISEEETQFALWAIFAAPLLMGNDLREINNDSKAILQNKEVIAINQDSLGKQGGYIWLNDASSPSQVIWMRELSDPKELAIVLQNLDDGGAGSFITFETTMIPSFVGNNWNSNTISFSVRDLYKQEDIGTQYGSYTAYVEPSSVVMIKITQQ